MKLDYKLPNNIKPILYEVTLKPYIGPFYGIKSFKFDGFLNLSFICLNPTNTIVLHSVDLEIFSSRLYELNIFDQDSIINVPKIKSNDIPIRLINTTAYDYDREFVIFYLNRKCEKDKNYVLELNFTGTILENLYGFYRSSYQDSFGNTH